MSALSSFIHIGEVIAKADHVRDAVNKLRDGIPDEEWETLIDAFPLLGDLWGACIDLEDVLDQG